MKVGGKKERGKITPITVSITHCIKFQKMKKDTFASRTDTSDR